MSEFVFKDLPGDSINTQSLAVADIDGDGLLDVVVGNKDNET